MGLKGKKKDCFLKLNGLLNITRGASRRLLSKRFTVSKIFLSPYGLDILLSNFCSICSKNETAITVPKPKSLISKGFCHLNLSPAVIYMYIFVLFPQNCIKNLIFKGFCYLT